PAKQKTQPLQSTVPNEQIERSRNGMRFRPKVDSKSLSLTNRRRRQIVGRASAAFASAFSWVAWHRYAAAGSPGSDGDDGPTAFLQSRSARRSCSKPFVPPA